MTLPVEAQTRIVYRATRVLNHATVRDDECGPYIDDCERRKSKTFLTLDAACKWAAMGALFNARHLRGCYDCEGSKGSCRLCRVDEWWPVVKRMARILKYRTKRAGRYGQGGAAIRGDQWLT